MSKYNILIMGASYGSLLASKILFGGHSVKLVCLPAEADLINSEGFRVRIPIRGRRELIELDSRKLPGRVSAAGTTDVDPREYDLIGLAMQEPQYGSPGVRELMNAVAKSRVPCMSIMNMPPLPYMRRIPGIDAELLKPAYTAPEVWKDFVPGAMTLCSPDPQAIRPPGEKANVLQVTLPTNFKVARFDVVRGNEIVRQLEKEIDAARLDTPEGKIELPVKLRFYDSIYVPLAKWAMLIAGNYRCITDDGIRTARDAVHSDLEASRSIYDFVLDICVKIGASRDELVPFEKYAAAAENLSRPASAARALNNGAPNIERADKLVQLAAKQKGMSHPARCDSGAGRSKTRDKSEDEARCGIVRQYTVLKISRKYAHFLFAVIQSGVTSAIASAVVSFRLLGDNLFLSNWLGSWLTSWALMVPIVLFAAPTIQRVTVLLTSDDV